MPARANRMAARKYSDTKQGILYPKIKKEELNGKEIHQSGRSCKGVRDFGIPRIQDYA